jgi:hypothetical protein
METAEDANKMGAMPREILEFMSRPGIDGLEERANATCSSSEDKAGYYAARKLVAPPSGTCNARRREPILTLAGFVT